MSIKVQPGVNEHLLCDEGIHVSVSGHGARTLLFVKDGTAIRFWADTEEVERVLNGDSLSLSAFGGSCKLQREGKRTRLEFDPDEGSRCVCKFSSEELAHALEDVRRTQEHQDVDETGN
ncbi:MAG TPA: hypothetical protein VG944_17545 [Fimbriimonas sp.]|nr:hypothetical protein [Fimbriimonas sp.]